MNIIPAADGLLAVNVFTVRPENQQALIDCIREAADPAELPGLLSMHLLRSHDGTRVINQMRWTDQAALRAATRGNAAITAAVRRVGELVEGAGPDHYDVIAVKD
ncbi:antibiotic biosynthesis monooxygenase family protein [Amycolatopsis sp. NPDC049688]|uniref:antibiotic biosynthesis monooxygenase family protein n=1 Tax=Amycolatopsis sp. NPDC049688 TaxID=3154733 RepID=UPI003433261A